MLRASNSTSYCTSWSKSLSVILTLIKCLNTKFCISRPISKLWVKDQLTDRMTIPATFRVACMGQKIRNALFKKYTRMDHVMLLNDLSCKFVQY